MVRVVNGNQLELQEFGRDVTFLVHISHIRKTTWAKMERSGRQPVPRAQKEPDAESESAVGSTIQAGPENVDEQEDQPRDEILNQPSKQMMEGSRQPAQLPAEGRQMPVVPQPMGENRDEQEYQPWDEILNQQMVEESWQPADRRQMPVVPQPMGEGKPPTFQYLSLIHI